MSYPPPSYSPSAVAQPQSVRIAVIAYMIAAALGLVVVIIGLATLPATIASTRTALQGTSGASGLGGAAPGIVIGAGVSAALFGIAFAILTFVFARKMGEGRNWARITLLVFAALQLFGLLGAYGAGFLHFAAMAVGAVFSFLPLSNVWFRERNPRSAAV